MKLGIVVVYLFGEESAPLLDLHLRQIGRNTGVPYTIYASANRLDSRYLDVLSRHPKVRICECPYTHLRGMREHAHYLDHLVRLAVEDGASHVVTLHLDSFPIRSGWAEELAGRLSASCVFATLDGINTACLFFHREFYLRYQPSFLLPTDDIESAEYRKYIDEVDPFEHSGIGYGFKAYQNGRSWHYLTDSTADDYPSAGKTYDKIIFHLGGAIRIGEPYSRPSGLFQSPGTGRLMEMLVAAARSATPRPVRTFLLKSFPRLISRFVDEPRYALQAQKIEQFKKDPEKYLRLLQK